MSSKRLILRLSSLGDIILASSVLEVKEFAVNLDWAVAREFSELLQGHPAIQQVFEFDRSTGIRGWVSFSRLLWKQQYDEIFDLHRTLRTRLLRVLFLFWSIKEGISCPRWKVISKKRWILYSYFLLKGLWPKVWRPTAWVIRFTQFVGGTGNERPNLNHLLAARVLPKDLQEFCTEQNKKFICVMPSSRWEGKKWPVDRYTQVFKHLSYFPVILGGKSDFEGIELGESLKQAQIPYFLAVGRWNLATTAVVLSQAEGYLGSDTGLAHLAEAVGTPGKVLFGPTTSDMGFGLWKPESQSIGSPLWCRPCGKDGRYCFRITQKYLCLKGLNAEVVLQTYHQKK